jgi:hypothetical protein
MENMNFVLSNGEQYAIAANEHLTNLLGELVIFRRKRKALRHEAELFGNCCP